MGSWTFILISLVFLAGWTLGNGRHGFDPYPFILLNLMLSCVAALQGAILLIAARRADQVSAERAQHDLAATMRTEASVHQVLALVQNLHDAGVIATGPQAPASGAHGDENAGGEDVRRERGRG